MSGKLKQDLALLSFVNRLLDRSAEKVVQRLIGKIEELEERIEQLEAE